jgi:hypothetical protein
VEPLPLPLPLGGGLGATGGVGLLGSGTGSDVVMSPSWINRNVNTSAGHSA